MLNLVCKFTITPRVAFLITARVYRRKEIMVFSLTYWEKICAYLICFKIMECIGLMHFWVCQPAYASAIVTDALAPNRRQAISSHHAGSIVTIIKRFKYHTTQHASCVTLTHWGPVTHICVSKLTIIQLVQTMACRLTGAKSSSEPMMEYC